MYVADCYLLFLLDMFDTRMAHVFIAKLQITTCYRLLLADHLGRQPKCIHMSKRAFAHDTCPIALYRPWLAEALQAGTYADAG